MTPRDLLEIEEELSAVVDDIEHRDEEYYLVRQIDQLRAIARKIGARAELIKLRGAT